MATAENRPPTTIWSGVWPYRSGAASHVEWNQQHELRSPEMIGATTVSGGQSTGSMESRPRACTRCPNGPSGSYAMPRARGVLGWDRGALWRQLRTRRRRRTSVAMAELARSSGSSSEERGNVRVLIVGAHGGLVRD